MVMQQNKIKRRMYTSPEALNSITARTRPKSIYDAPTRPKPPSARGGATMDPPGSSIGFERTGTAAQPVGDRFGDAVKAGRVSAGTPVQQRRRQG